MGAETGWVDDILGAPFQKLTLELEPDNEGPVVATLVRRLPNPGFFRRVFGARPALFDVDVLYVHGWSDYFFQTSVAKFWTDRGARFFALDLRKYGRSLRDGQTFGYITDLATYSEDIAAALAAMGWDVEKPRTDRRLVLMGHSTGGLTLSLWAAAHPGVATAVVLNSPWLSMQVPGGTRGVVSSLLHWQASLAPMEIGPQLDLGFYSRAQTEVADANDPMQVNLEWRPEQSKPVRTGWLNAISHGHKQVHAGLGIDCPVTVLLSARSELPVRWSDALTKADTVLFVDDVAVEALRLGPTVTLECIDGALHDVFLSRREARADAYRRLARFADTLPPRR